MSDNKSADDLGARVNAPSDAFPAHPHVSLACPAGWEPFVWVGAHLGVRHTVSTSGMAPNVLVTVERFPGAFTAADAAGMLRQRLAAGKATERYATEAADSGHAGTYFETEMRDPKFGPVEVRYHQAVLVRPTPLGDVTDVVTAVGTCTRDQVKHIGPQVTEIVRGMRVTEPS